MKILNNIGIIGSIIAGIADIVIVIIFVVGVEFKQDITSTVIFSVINTLIGLLINVLLRYQGQKYAEIENEEICNKYYKKKVKYCKKFVSMREWQVLSFIKDVFVKGGISSFTIAGTIYISIEGSKNPVQILITIVTLFLFACFGLMNMNSSYCRFYNIQLPYMEFKIKEMEESKNGNN